jgi:hypothetical protein
MYTLNIGVLWTATRILAPAERKPSVWRCLGAAVLMTFFGNGCYKILDPLIGDWYVLVKLVAYVIATTAVFKLAWWRSCLVALIFYVGVLAQYVLLFGESTK